MTLVYSSCGKPLDISPPPPPHRRHMVKSYTFYEKSSILPTMYMPAKSPTKISTPEADARTSMQEPAHSIFHNTAVERKKAAKPPSAPLLQYLFPADTPSPFSALPPPPPSLSKVVKPKSPSPRRLSPPTVKKTPSNSHLEFATAKNRVSARLLPVIESLHSNSKTKVISIW